jgi:hypothetical protein
MSQLVDRLIEETKPEKSTAELIMRMVPLPDEIKLDETFPTRVKKSVKELQNRVIDRIPAQDTHQRYHDLASEVIDIADEMIQLADLVSWLITPVRGQYLELSRGASLTKAAKAYAKGLINRKLVDRAVTLAKELDPTGYAVYRMNRGEDIDWL